jgi:hypothetical protein
MSGRYAARADLRHERMFFQRRSGTMLAVDGLARAIYATTFLVVALAVLTWCSINYVRVNPRRRLPGRLPDTVHPPAFMSLGTLGIICTGRRQRCRRWMGGDDMAGRRGRVARRITAPATCA